MSKKHKLQMNQWQGPLLRKVERVFESFEEALQFLLMSKSESGKIYDYQGDLIHSGPGGEHHHHHHNEVDEFDSYA